MSAAMTVVIRRQAQYEAAVERFGAESSEAAEALRHLERTIRLAQECGE